MPRKKNNDNTEIQEEQKMNAEINEEMSTENFEDSQIENSDESNVQADEATEYADRYVGEDENLPPEAAAEESVSAEEYTENNTDEVQENESKETESEEALSADNSGDDGNEDLSDSEAIKLDGEESPEKEENAQATPLRFKVLEFYNPDGTRKRAADLSRGENMARDAQINHRIVSGTVEAAIRNQQYGTYALVNYRGLMIIIPARKMGLNYEDIESQVTARYRNTHQGDVNSAIIQAEVDRRAKNQIGEMVGSRIQFEIVGGLDGAVAGDRERALMRMKRYYFITSSNAVQVGDKITGDVIRVHVRDIRVSALGCEFKLTPPELTADFVSDLHDKFSVGERIELTVTEITGREDVNTSSFKAFCDTHSNMSVKAITANSANRRDIIAQKLEKYPRGTVVRGIVNYVTDGGICVIALSNGCAACCYANFLRRTPRRGDNVKFQVDKIDRDRNRLTGRILEVERRTEF